MIHDFKFDIDPGKPVGIKETMGSASDVADAIELCFPLQADDAELIWGTERVPINYKYDVSVIYEDIVELLQECMKNKRVEVYFGSNTFSGSLSVTPFDDEFELEGRWDSVSGNKEKQLNQISVLKTKKSRFLRSWSGILENVLEAVGNSNLSFSLATELDELRLLLEKSRTSEKGDGGI